MGSKINLWHTCARNLNDNPAAEMCFKRTTERELDLQYTIQSHLKQDVASEKWHVYCFHLPGANSTRELAGSISAAVFGEKA